MTLLVIFVSHSVVRATRIPCLAFHGPQEKKSCSQSLAPRERAVHCLAFHHGMAPVQAAKLLNMGESDNKTKPALICVNCRNSAQRHAKVCHACRANMTETAEVITVPSHISLSSKGNGKGFSHKGGRHLGFAQGSGHSFGFGKGYGKQYWPEAIQYPSYPHAAHMQFQGPWYPKGTGGDLLYKEGMVDRHPEEGSPKGCTLPGEPNKHERKSQSRERGTASDLEGASAAESEGSAKSALRKSRNRTKSVKFIVREPVVEEQPAPQQGGSGKRTTK